jgi:anti-sigma regulatory factor (Ser/Thr protein kinase)
VASDADTDTSASLSHDPLGQDALRHELFVHGDDHTYIGRVAPYLRAGLEEGATTILVTCPRRWSGVREALGPDADHVVFLNRDHVFVRPAVTLAAYERTLTHVARPDGPTTRILGELAGGPDPADWSRWMMYEAALRPAFAAHNAWIVCAYDSRETPDHILDAVLRCHPEQFGDHPARTRTTTYTDPAAVMGASTPMPAPKIHGLHDLGPFQSAADLRGAMAGILGATGLPPARAAELLLAINEAAVNAFVHGGAPVTARAGTPGGRLIVEISDSGPGLNDPLAGWMPPRTSHGAGLWIARQLTSRVELLPRTDGLTIRLWQ